jgi:hypothetical protein
MKAIIDDKLYDTEKAELILEFSRSFDAVDIFGRDCKGWKNMELYRTKKGNYIEVDLRSKKIELTSEYCAKELLRKINPDKYIELFGEVEEG